MIRRPPRSTLFPTRRSSDLHAKHASWTLGSLQSSAPLPLPEPLPLPWPTQSVGDRKSTRLNSSHMSISYAVFCLKKKKKKNQRKNEKINSEKITSKQTDQRE